MSIKELIKVKNKFNISVNPKSKHAADVNIYFCDDLTDLKFLSKPELKSITTKYNNSELKDLANLDFIFSGSRTLIFKSVKNQEAYFFNEFIRDSLKGIINNKNYKNISINIKNFASNQQQDYFSTICEFCLLENWSHPKISSQEKSTKKTSNINIHTSIKHHQALLRMSEIVAENNSLVRSLAECPPNFLSADKYIDWIKTNKKHFSELGIKISVDTCADLKKKKAGAFLAVAQAGPNYPGGIVKLSYSPKKSNKKTKTVTLVGKGICYDTGGLNIKTENYMRSMKRDMTGSAVALASIIAIAQSKFNVCANAYLAITENHVSADAYKMDDVVVANDGTSIEIIHTDAEGRMALADTLAFTKKINQDLIIDYATLTGAAVYCLTTRRSSVFSKDLKLSKLAVKVGDQCGERLWDFPLSEDYTKDLKKSKNADLYQCNPGKGADHIYAACFLGQFIPKDTPWLHIDLASEENPGGLGLVSSDVTGFGVKWTINFVKKYFDV